MGPPQGLNRPPVALTIAGTDSGGGAGIAADLKTFRALGVHGALAVTAVTAQDTRGISGVHEVPAAFVVEQIDRVAADIGIDAAKTGMLGSEGVVAAVAQAVERWGIRNLVVDPVLAATSGRPLLDPRGLSALIRWLLPLAAVVTPNLAEAGALLGREVASVGDMHEAASAIGELGPAAVLVTGGHLPGDPVDVLFDGSRSVELAAQRLPAGRTHGSGCTLSAAIAAHLALGTPLPDAVRAAKGFVTEAIRYGLALGRGEGPVNPGPSGRPG